MSLLIAILLLLAPRLTGLPVHEWLGVVLCAGLLIHLLLAWPWISAASRRLVTAGPRLRVNFILNLLLFILIAIEVVSGMAISQVALPFIGIHTINDRTWRAIHNQTLNITHVAVGLHVAMNWRWLLTSFRDSTRERLDGAGALLARSVMLAVAAGIVATVLFATAGPPSPLRIYTQSELARFRPTLGHGVVQLTGEGALLALIIYAGRRWLRIRI